MKAEKCEHCGGDCKIVDLHVLTFSGAIGAVMIGNAAYNILAVIIDGVVAGFFA